MRVEIPARNREESGLHRMPRSGTARYNRDMQPSIDSRGSLASADAPPRVRDGSWQSLPLATLGLATALVMGLLAFGVSRSLAAAFVATLNTSPPPSREIRLASLFYDDTPVPVTVSVEWQRVESVVPAWRLLSDATLWRAMRLEDWNRVPLSLRAKALSAMLERYRPALAGPAAWSAMDAFDWDGVPSPVRVMAFLRMIDVHVSRLAAGAAFGRNEREISDTVGAIVMVESWFEHRAINVNESGDRDLGLSQASTECRRQLAQLQAKGRIAVGAREEDYFDPWKATAVAVFWYLRELNSAGGDEGLAIRAYHTGMKAARVGKGMEYLERVIAKRRQFIRNQEAPPSWRLMFANARFGAMPPGAPARAGVEARPLGDARLIAEPGGSGPAVDTGTPVVAQAAASDVTAGPSRSE